MNSDKDDGPAFPCQASNRVGASGPAWDQGMSLRDYFAAHAPEPSAEDVSTVQRREQIANPHNDSYKPRRHDVLDIRCALRYAFADAMLAARSRR